MAKCYIFKDKESIVLDNLGPMADNDTLLQAMLESSLKAKEIDGYLFVMERKCNLMPNKLGGK